MMTEDRAISGMNGVVVLAAGGWDQAIHSLDRNKGRLEMHRCNDHGMV